MHLLELDKGSSRGHYPMAWKHPPLPLQGVKWEVYWYPNRPAALFSSFCYSQNVCGSSAGSLLFRVQQMNFNSSGKVSKEEAPGHRDSGVRLWWLIAQEPTGWVTLDKAPSKDNCLNDCSSGKISWSDWCPGFLVSGWLPAMALPRLPELLQ